MISALVLDELAYRLILAWLREDGVADPLSEYRAHPKKTMRAVRQRLAVTWVIQEFVHVRARRRDRADAAALGRDYAEILSPLLILTADDLAAGLAIFERNDSLGAFDAVLAACAARAEVEALVSADGTFAELAEISHVVPDRSGLSRLIVD